MTGFRHLAFGDLGRDHGVLILVEDVAIEVEVAERVVGGVLLDVDVSISVVLGDRNAKGSFRPRDQNSSRVFWGHDRLHALAKLDAMQHKVLVVVLEKDLGVVDHVVGGWKLDHLGDAILLGENFTHRERSIWCASFHKLLHLSHGLLNFLLWDVVKVDALKIAWKDSRKGRTCGRPRR